MIEEKIIRKPELLEIVGVSHPTIWRWEQKGLFPKRVSLGKNSTGWVESEIRDWLQKKVGSR